MTTNAKSPRAWVAAAVGLALAAAVVGACTPRQAEDFLHAAGKIAYDSMKARQPAR